MKRFLFVFIVCIILNAFSGCTNKKDPKIEYLQEYFAAEKAAKNSPQTITKIFLDFEFGMSPQEVKDHFNTLKKAGKIHTDRGGFYYSAQKGLAYINHLFGSGKRASLQIATIDGKEVSL